MYPPLTPLTERTYDPLPLAWLPWLGVPLLQEEVGGRLERASAALTRSGAARRSAGEPPREPREPLANGAAAAKRRKSAAQARMRRWRRPPLGEPLSQNDYGHKKTSSENYILVNLYKSGIIRR